jgi:hypothetical protein
MLQELKIMPLLEEFTARRIQHGPKVLVVLQGVAKWQDMS